MGVAVLACRVRFIWAGCEVFADFNDFFEFSVFFATFSNRVRL